MIVSERLRQMSTTDLALLGVQEVAYVKPVMVDGSTAYGVFAANGTQAGILPTREAAFAAIREHGLEPVSVH